MKSAFPLALKQDLVFLIVAATASLCVGLAINQLRDKPIPLVYQSKSQRLESAVERLASEAPPSVSPTAPDRDWPETLSLTEFSEFVDGKSGLILDARPEIFHRLGHVPGAISLPRDDFETVFASNREMLEGFINRPVVLYCSGSSCEDSHLVKKSLVALGFTKVSIFQGGWSEWTDAGKPEEIDR